MSMLTRQDELCPLDWREQFDDVLHHQDFARSSVFEQALYLLK